MPFSGFFAQVSERLSCPVPATLFVGKLGSKIHIISLSFSHPSFQIERGNTLANNDLVLAVVATGLGAIPIGSSTAFLDLTGSFIILTTVSYLIPFLGNIMTKRQNFPKGPFHLGKWGTPINVTSVVMIIFFDIFYCFRKN